jgi:two-component system sensor histidine kinase UhpB
MYFPSPWHRALRLVLLAVVALAALGGATGAQAQVSGDGVLRLDQALTAQRDAARFPEDDAARTLRLPDDWAVNHPRYAGAVWYRVHLDALPPTDGDLLALYIEHVCSNVEVYLNGALLMSGGRMSEPVTRNCHQPQIIALPRPLLQAGANTLDLKVAGYPLQRVAARDRAGSLSALHIGPYQALVAQYEHQRLLDVALPQVTSGTLALLGGLMLVLGWMNRRDSHVLYFAALAIGWALVNARLWLRELPLSNDAAELLIASCLPPVALAAVRFTMRYAGWKHRVIDAALLAQCVIVPASLAAAGPGRLFVLASSWYLVLALEALAALVFCLVATWRWRRARFWPATLTLPAIAVCVAVELAAQQVPIDARVLHAAQVAMPLLFIAIGLWLLRQVGLALRAAEAGQHTMELRIREATSEIEKNFAQLAEMRVEQVTERERKRIAADLHDDLGAKLLTIVHTSDSERISSLAREALEEMRLSVRGLTGKPVRLLDALGDWRAEVVSRLSQAGIEAEWSSPADEIEHTFSARSYVQTTRIMREAVSNIIKHSGASHCSVRSQIADGDFQIVIQDNGNGIPMELDGKLDRGHGMASMKHRAKQLQGQCLVESGPGYGTVIRLTLPL